MNERELITENRTLRAENERLRDALEFIVKRHEDCRHALESAHQWRETGCKRCAALDALAEKK